MAERLLEYEWQNLSQMIYRINRQRTYEAFAATLLEQINSIIQIDQGLVFKAEREGEKLVLKDAVVRPQTPDYLEYKDKYMQNNYSVRWMQYLNSPWSSVFRYSAITSQWENSEVYDEILKPLNMYYAIYITLVHREHPVGAVALWRKKDSVDFTEKDLYLLEILKIHMELKMYSLQYYDVEPKKQNKKKDVSRTALGEFGEKYNLTKRELEIVQLIANDKESSEICELLYISDSTLRKHIHNIYQKAGIKSRIQLLRKIKITD